MRILFLLLALTLFNNSSAQITLEDDGLHFLTGAAISSGTYALVYSKTKNKKIRIILGAILSNLIVLFDIVIITTVTSIFSENEYINNFYLHREVRRNKTEECLCITNLLFSKHLARGHSQPL